MRRNVYELTVGTREEYDFSRPGAAPISTRSLRRGASNMSIARHGWHTGGSTIRQLQQESPVSSRPVARTVRCPSSARQYADASARTR